MNMVKRSFFYSIVRLCERIHNKQKVVIKEIKLHFDDAQVKAAKNEVTILKSLHHPNIIQYLDNFNSKTTFSIVMEYATKGTLQELIEKERKNSFSPQVGIDRFIF